jgi:clan AA aspartic protease
MKEKTTSQTEGLRLQNNLRTIRSRRHSGAWTEKSTNEANTPMGEVRVKVKLTNGVEEALVRRGLLAADQVRSYEANALVDTGAVRSVLPVQVVQHLGLRIARKTRATYANDSSEDVDVSEMVGIDIIGRGTSEEMLVLGSEVIIGQTVLESLDLLVDCTNRRVIPNPAHPDQPVIKIKWICQTTQVTACLQNESLEVRA